jgi:hypothetical protein
LRKKSVGGKPAATGIQARRLVAGSAAAAPRVSKKSRQVTSGICKLLVAAKNPSHQSAVLRRQLSGVFRLYVVEENALEAPRIKRRQRQTDSVAGVWRQTGQIRIESHE